MQEPKPKKITPLKPGTKIRILLGPRKGETDFIKEVLTTLQKSVLYTLNGDKERLGYQAFAVVEESKAVAAEELAKEAHFKDFSVQQNNSEQNETPGKSLDKPGIDTEKKDAS